jgi:hypothetical protein
MRNNYMNITVASVGVVVTVVSIPTVGSLFHISYKREFIRLPYIIGSYIVPQPVVVCTLEKQRTP